MNKNKINHSLTDYCYQKAIKPGSNLYYSLRFAKPPFHPGLLALFALEAELQDTAKNISDPEVAKKKLSWWAEEITRTFDPQTPNPRHPVTQALFQFAPVLFLAENRENQLRCIQSMLQAALWDIDYQGYQTYDDIKIYAECQKGPLIQLALVILLEQDLDHINNPDIKIAATQLGIALQFNHIIQFLGRDIRNNKLYFPEEELAKYQIKSQDILALINHPTSGASVITQLNHYLTFLSQRAQTEYQSAITSLTTILQKSNPQNITNINIKQKIKPIILLAHLEFILLNRIQKSDFNIINQRIELTPIEKFVRAFIF